jgi:hypothetical protein
MRRDQHTIIIDDEVEITVRTRCSTQRGPCLDYSCLRTRTFSAKCSK